MFGYISPCMSRLSLSDAEIYQGFYCGLCRAMGRYGFTSRAALTYDCTFLTVLLTSLSKSEAGIPFTRKVCIAHPMRGSVPSVNMSPELDFCAAVGVMLCDFKIRDDIRDGDGIRRALLPFVSGGAKKASSRYPEAASVISCGMEDIYNIESADSDRFDDAPSRFGQMLSDLVGTYPMESSALPAMCELARAVGSFIYICDAWDDRTNDERKGLYNVFNRCGRDGEFAGALLDMYITNAELAYDLIDVRRCGTLLDNIVHFGLRTTANAVLHPSDKKRPREGSF